MNILFEDNHVLVADKPAGLLTQDRDRPNLEGQLRSLIKKRDQKPGNVFLHALHRLDKPVRGLVLFAKSQKALRRLQEGMRRGDFQKEYHAWVEGRVAQKKGRLTHYHRHGDHQAILSDEEKEGYKRAELFFEVVEQKDNLTRLRIELITGRYHQIRAQLSHIGHPIVGDRKYGSETKSESIQLEHTSLSFTHPVTKCFVHDNFRVSRGGEAKPDEFDR